MSDQQDLKILLDQTWEYFEPKLKEAMRSHISYFRADVRENPGGGKLLVAKPFEDPMLVSAMPSVAEKEAGESVTVLRFGSGENASNYIAAADGAALNIGGDPVVVASGEEGGWRYRRWSNGLYECWTNRQYSGQPSSQWGAMKCLVCNSPYYPISFENVQYASRKVFAVNARSFFDVSYSPASNTNPGQFALVRPDNAEIVAKGYFYAIGNPLVQVGDFPQWNNPNGIITWDSSGSGVNWG